MGLHGRTPQQVVVVRLGMALATLFLSSEISPGASAGKPGRTTNRMRNIEVCATAVANAIRASNGNRITTDAAKAAKGEIIKASAPEDMLDNLETFSNLSALNQGLERVGLVSTERTLSALETAIKAKLALPA